MAGEENEIVEDAIAKRLARLGGMPVETVRLEARLMGVLPGRATNARGGMRIWWKTITGIAASLILLAIVGWAVLGGGWGGGAGEAQASMSDLARFHEEMIAGKDTMHAGSVAEANQMIAAMASGPVTVPGLPDSHLHSCCMRTMKNKPVACVLLEMGDAGGGGEPITMTVAKASDMKTPACPAECVGGVDYHLQHVGELNMVMTERHGRWICLVSKASKEKLMDVAGKLVF